MKDPSCDFMFHILSLLRVLGVYNRDLQSACTEQRQSLALERLRALHNSRALQLAVQKRFKDLSPTEGSCVSN